MIFNSPKEAIQFISEAQELSFEESFGLANFCSKLGDSAENERIARDIVIRVLDKWYAIPEATRDVWNALIESVGLFPYIDVESDELSLSSSLCHEFHKSPFLENIYLHREQQILSLAIQSQQSVVVS